MAQEILSSVITVAQFIYDVYKSNLELREEEQELANTVQILLSSIQGLRDAGNYLAALSSLLFYLSEARKVIEVFEKRRKQGKKWTIAPKAQLAKIKSLTDKLMKVTSLLSAAFGANINRLAETGAIGGPNDKKGFDSLAIIGHASAKKFWRKHVGAETFSTSWTRFKLAFKAEYKMNLPNTLLSDDNLLIMKSKLDPDGDDDITVYEFADYTDSCGVLKSFIDQVAPQGGTVVPPSRGTRDDILKRSVFLDGGFAHDFGSCTPLRLWIEEFGTLLKWARHSSGMMLELCEDESPSLLLSAAIPDKFRHRRLAIRVPSCPTCDELLEAAMKENEERDRKEQQASGPLAEEASVAQVELQVKVMEEQAEQKQEEVTTQAQAELVALDVKMEQMISEIKSSDQHEAKRLEEEVRKKFEGDKQTVMVAWRTRQEEIDKCAADDKDKVIKSCPFQRLANTIFTKAKSKVNDEFHDNFPLIDPEEFCVHYYHCSENAGKNSVSHYGLLYVTRIALYFFSSSIAGNEVRTILKFEDLFSMAKTTLNLWPNAITFMFRWETDTRSIQYGRFLGRDGAYTAIERQWMSYAEQFLPGKIHNTSARSWYMATGFKVVKEGWLDKKGDVIKNYKRRWFVLTDRTLSYHKEKGKTALKTVCLQSVGDVRVDDKSSQPDKQHFLILTKDRTFRIVGAHSRERVEWVNQIKECMASLRYRFYYGIMQVGKSCEAAPQWIVLEMNFNSKKFLIWKDGAIIITINFNQLHIADRGSSPLSLNILLKESKESRYQFQCQTLDEREYLLTFINGLVEEMAQAEEAKQEAGVTDEAKVRAEACTVDNSGHEESLIRLQQLRAVISRKSHVDIVGSLRRRYIVLEQLGALGRFMIYKDDTQVIPLEIISLNHVVIMTDVNHPRVVALHALARTPFVFRLESQAVRDEWIVAINSYLKRAHTVIDDGFGRPTPNRIAAAAIPIPSSPISRDSNPIISVRNSPLSPSHSSSSLLSPTSVVSPSILGGSASTSFAPTAGGILGTARLEDKRDASSAKSITRGQLEDEVRRLKEELERAAIIANKDRDTQAIVRADTQSRLIELDARRSDADRRAADAERRAIDAERRITALNQRAIDADELYKEMERQLMMASQKHMMDQQRLINAILKRGSTFVKHQKAASPNSRFIYLSQDGTSLCWSDNEKAAEKKKYKDIKVRTISDVKSGYGTDAFKNKKPGMELQCLSVISSERSLDLQAPDQLTRDVWVDLLRGLLSPSTSSTPKMAAELPLGAVATSPRAAIEESKQSSASSSPSTIVVPGTGNIVAPA